MPLWEKPLQFKKFKIVTDATKSIKIKFNQITLKKLLARFGQIFSRTKIWK